MGYAIGVLALGESLVNADPGRRRLCMVTRETHPSAKAVLKSSGLWELFEVDVPPNMAMLTTSNTTALTDSADVRKLAGTFTKLKIFDSKVHILANLDMFVFIDADAFVRHRNKRNSNRNNRNDSTACTNEIVSLFDIDLAATNDPFYSISAAQNIPVPRCVFIDAGFYGFFKQVCFSKQYEFNTGVLRIIPGKTASSIYDMLYRDPSAIDLPWGEWNTDQAVLNELLDYQQVTTLNRKFNSLICCSFYDPQLIDVANKAVIAHFSLSALFKPWMMLMYERRVQLGEKTIEDYANEGVARPFHVPDSIHHDVYLEWKQFAENGMLRLNVDERVTVDNFLIGK